MKKEEKTNYPVRQLGNTTPSLPLMIHLATLPLPLTAILTQMTVMTPGDRVRMEYGIQLCRWIYIVLDIDIICLNTQVIYT
jgi:hypothetical protein